MRLARLGWRKSSGVELETEQGTPAEE
jgi:hypothetical protein